MKIYANFTDDRGVELAAFVDAGGKVGGVCTAKCLRPIRSEADKKRDESVSALIEFDLRRKTASIQNLYPELYDAIAAGKIPGIRID